MKLMKLRATVLLSLALALAACSVSEAEAKGASFSSARSTSFSSTRSVSSFKAPTSSYKTPVAKTPSSYKTSKTTSSFFKSSPKPVGAVKPASSASSSWMPLWITMLLLDDDEQAPQNPENCEIEREGSGYEIDCD